MLLDGAVRLHVLFTFHAYSSDNVITDRLTKCKLSSKSLTF